MASHLQNLATGGEPYWATRPTTAGNTSRERPARPRASTARYDVNRAVVLCTSERDHSRRISGGQWRIRTSVGRSRLIYSQVQLSTLPTAQTAQASGGDN